MIDQKKFHECLNEAGVDFITGVPDTRLNDYCSYIAENIPNDRHVIAANEGNAVAIAAGYHLATGKIPLVYMQNSGLSNAMSPLLSLTNKEVYSIPMILLIGWRGDPAISDHAHHQKAGLLTPVLLEAMDIPLKVLHDDEDDASNAARWAVKTARDLNAPVALVVKKDVLAKAKKKLDYPETDDDSMHRQSAIACILDTLPNDTIYVATTGRATRELYRLHEMSGVGHDSDFLNVGAMGHTSSISVGIALAKKDRLVVCLDGDAAAIMHMGSFTTSSVLKPANFLHIVLNNGIHESVGGQPSAGFKINFTAIAENSGYKTIGNAVKSGKDLHEAVKKLTADGGPSFLDVHILKGGFPPPLNTSIMEMKNSFMKVFR